MPRLAVLVCILLLGARALSSPPRGARGRRRAWRAAAEDDWDYDEHTVVEYEKDAQLRLGVVLLSGAIQPLCAWRESDEADELELLWDEDEDAVDAALARKVLDAYPSTRIVDGGIGPRNPHGEESEDVYFVNRAELSSSTVVVVKPDREIFW